MEWLFTLNLERIWGVSAYDLISVGSVSMNHSPSSRPTPCFIFIAIGMLTFLILLINISFKIILLQGLVFAVSSLLCPVIAALYLLALRYCSLKEQRHLLNLALMTLYLFCIGIYVLVNLPAAEYMNENPVYQIIFDDIPKKFFATTISFSLSFYLPHLLFCAKSSNVLYSPKKCALLAVLGGLGFFCMDFYLLFSGPHAHSFRQVFIDSLMIASLLLLIIGVVYLFFFLNDKQHESNNKESTLSPDALDFPLYEYLLCFAVAVTLMCLACEYRLIALSGSSVLAASSIFFPITIMISTVIAELWGHQAQIKLTAAVIVAQLIFDTSLMIIVSFPSPSFFNLNPFYDYMMPRRLPAASLSLLVTFLSNGFLLHYFQTSQWRLPRPFRILASNVLANSLLCLIDYSVLFGGIYSYDQIINLAKSVWQYKLVTTLLALPFVLWLCKRWETANHLA
jgi:hypothetical protein